MMCEKEAWFFGYGSLIFDPEYKCQKLEDWCEQPIDGYNTPGNLDQWIR
jgi:cation transport regulator ChaC